jgi:hypothetical protein
LIVVEHRRLDRVRENCAAGGERDGPAVAARTAVPAGQATAGQAIAGQDGYPQRWLMLPVILIAMFMAGFEVTFSS